MNLRTRLALLLALIGVGTAALMAFSSLRVTTRRLDTVVTASLVQYANRLQEADGRLVRLACGLAKPERFLPAVDGSDTRGGARRPRRALRDPDPNLRGILIQCLDQSGKVVQTSGTEIPVRSQDREAAAGRGGDTVIRARTSGHDADALRILSIPIKSVPPIGLVQAARSLAETRRVRDDLLPQYAALALLAATLAAIAGWLLARRTAKPIVALTVAAEHVATTGDLDVTLTNQAATKNRDETGRLARSFNTMLSSLRASQDQQARLVQDAGHELRTPITSIRTNISTLMRHRNLAIEQRDQILADVDDELRELTALTNELVALAGNNVQLEAEGACDLADLTQSSVDRLLRRTDRTVTTTLVTAPMVGQPGGITRAIDNLLANAAKFSAQESPIEVSISSVDGSHRLTVRDHGPGISAIDLPRIFDRFYRSDQARTLPGSGLGLSIVREIVMAQGGSVSARNHPDGGAEFTLQFPTTARDQTDG